VPPATIDRLLALYAECSAAGEYEAAYHLLMAALHVADHAREAQALARIGEACDQLEREIEAAAPPHLLSAAHARLRGQQPLCDSLRVHIEAVRLRLLSDEQRAHRSSSPA
jgi:hypothetical protein